MQGRLAAAAVQSLDGRMHAIGADALSGVPEWMLGVQPSRQARLELLAQPRDDRAQRQAADRASERGRGVYKHWQAGEE
jgi:hypothetical protein